MSPTHHLSTIAVLLSSTGLNPNCPWRSRPAKSNPPSPGRPCARLWQIAMLNHASTCGRLPPVPSQTAPPPPHQKTASRTAEHPLCVGHLVLAATLRVRPHTSDPSQRRELRWAGATAGPGLPSGLLAQLGFTPRSLRPSPHSQLFNRGGLPCTPVPHASELLSAFGGFQVSLTVHQGRPPRLGPSAQMPTPPTVLRGRYTCAPQSQLCHRRQVPVPLQASISPRVK